MKSLLLASLLMLSCNSSFAQEDEEEVAPQEKSIPSHSSSGESLDPEKAKDIMDKLRSGQKTREDQNKFIEELDTEE
jgi:hypothetical protein